MSGLVLMFSTPTYRRVYTSSLGDMKFKNSPVMKVFKKEIDAMDEDTMDESDIPIEGKSTKVGGSRMMVNAAIPPTIKTSKKTPPTQAVKAK